MLSLRDDEELCALFKAESDEHMQRLSAGLLRLEHDPGDRPTLEELFREAHTLKGSAGMVGASSIQAIAHRFEDLLGSASRGELALEPVTIGRMFRALDAIQKLINEAVSGTPAGINLWDVLAALEDGEEAPSSDASNEEEARPDHPVEVPAFEASHAIDAPSSEIEEPSMLPATRAERDVPAASADLRIEGSDDRAGHNRDDVLLHARLRIDTIRVEARKLDSLMTHAGELTVAATRLGLRLAEIEELLAHWEEVSRIAAQRHTALGGLQGALDDAAKRVALERLNLLQTREEESLERLGAVLRRVNRSILEDNAKLDFLSFELAEGIRSIRMLPLAAVFNLFPRMVRDLAYDQGKDVQLLIEGGETGVDKRILEEIKDPLMHMIRNAIDHGIEPREERRQRGKPAVGTIRLRAYQTASNTVIEVIDDGRGLDLAAIRRTALDRGIVTEGELAKMSESQVQGLIYSPGFSTRGRVTDISGRGVGMDVVRANIERLKGTIHLETSSGAGCLLRIQLPLTIATARMLILGVREQSFAIPVEVVKTALMVSPDDIRPVEGRDTIHFEGRSISIASLADLLELPSPATRPGEASRAASPCVIVSDGEELYGLIVDALLDEQEVVLKPDSPVLRRVRNVAGSTILGSGRVCVILNPHDLLRSIRLPKVAPSRLRAPDEPRRKRSILLVEDSITTRTQVKRILEGAGYDVVAAVDGVDGLTKLGSRAFDAVISDVQMPNMDGLTLVSRIRQEKRYSELPVILMTSLAQEEDRRRGIEVGASAYLTKPTFDQNVLLDTLRRLL